MAISPQWLTIYLYSTHRAVIFATAQLFCFIKCLLQLHEAAVGTMITPNANVQAHRPTKTFNKLSRTWMIRSKASAATVIINQSILCIHCQTSLSISDAVERFILPSRNNKPRCRCLSSVTRMTNAS